MVFDAAGVRSPVRVVDIEWVDEVAFVGCKVCGFTGDGRRCAEIRGSRQPVISAVRCPSCASVMFDVDEVRQYTESAEVDDYIENLGSIETIGGFLSSVEPESVRTFLDIGCSFGFGPHLGREIFGWDVVGIEPGAGARRGAKELGVEIRDEFFDERTRFDHEFDFILSSEVVEHVPDPVSFLRAVRSHLAPTGRALFTTPAAEAVADGESKAEALVAISPGDHGFLTSVRGLGLMLERAGWESFDIQRTGRSIIAAASRRAGDDLTVDTGRPTPEELIDYFDRQADRALPGSALSTGMASRHLRALVNRGRYGEATASAARVVDAVRARHGVDLGDVAGALDRFASGGTVPLNSISFAYHAGILNLIGTGDYAGAIEHFDLAISAADGREVMFGKVDPDSDDLRINAYRHRALAAAYAADPRVTEFVTVVRDRDDAASAARWTMSVFEHLVQGSAFGLARRVLSVTEREDERAPMVRVAATQYGDAIARRDWRRARRLAAVMRSGKGSGLHSRGLRGFRSDLAAFPRIYFVARLIALRLRPRGRTRASSS